MRRTGESTKAYRLAGSRSGVVLSLSLCLSLLCGPWARAQAPTEAPEPPPGNSRIKGVVFRSDGKTRVPGATVLAYHLDTGTVFHSEPSDAKGSFEIGQLPYGYVDLSVETDEGVFLGNVVVSVPPGGTVAVRFGLVPYSEKPAEAWRLQGRETEVLPGKPTAGVAEVRTRRRGREFWKSPSGLAIIGGSAGAALLVIASGSGDGQTASPSSP